jgi:hypothetical protein
LFLHSLKKDKNEIKFHRYHNEYESTFIQELVHTDNFHFHYTACLEFDLHQNGFEITPLIIVLPYKIVLRCYLHLHTHLRSYNFLLCTAVHIKFYQNRSSSSTDATQTELMFVFRVQCSHTEHRNHRKHFKNLSYFSQNNSLLRCLTLVLKVHSRQMIFAHVHM